MYDPKFEKGVRQKMEGLEFIPSESIWVNIEKAVGDRQRRRVAFYFWRFALPGFLLAGAVGIGYFATRPANPTTAKSTHQAVTIPAATNPAAASSTATNPRASTPAATTPAVTTPVAASSTPATTSTASATPTTASTTLTTKTATKTRSTTTRQSPHRGITSSTSSATPNRAQPQTTEPAEIEAITASATPTASTTTTGSSTATASTPAPYLYQPNLAGRRDAASIHAASLSAKKTTIALHTLEKKKHPWEAGFTGGIGISRLNHLTITQSNNSLASANAFYNINSATASNDKHYVSDVRPGLSYTGGIYLQKPLTDRWILNLGMNLHFYSTRITVGQPVSSYVSSTVSLIAAVPAASVQSTNTYSAGDDEQVTNHYYFLELPVGMQFKVNKSKMLPVFLEGGFSLSRLMGSNALFYNSHSGVYYKDESVLQKTQFNVYSAVMVGLPFHGVHIEVGPQLQYGLTPLINNHSLGDQHFLYTGIRFIVMPGK